jgi:hypothetical protein
MFYVYLMASSNFRRNAKIMFGVFNDRVTQLTAPLQPNPKMVFPAVSGS